MHLTVCYYHATYAFKSESTFYNYLNVKKLLLQSRRKICSLSNCNWTQTHNHLVCKQTLNHSAKQSERLASVVCFYLCSAYDCMILSCLVSVSEWIHTPQPNDWAKLWVLLSTVHLTVCSYHVTYSFESESTLYSCLNVKNLFTLSRRKIWSLR